LRIWILSFESKYTKKVGGLAEVPPSLAYELSKLGHEAYVIVPSHGFATEKKDELRLVFENKTVYGDIEVYIYDKPGIPHIIIGGGVLEDPEVYSPRTMYDKIRLFSMGLRLYVEHLLEKNIFPNIVHGNDWHSVPIIISLKSVLDIPLDKKKTKYIYQIHLLSEHKFSLEDISSNIGVDQETVVTGTYGARTIREYYELSSGYADRLGGLLSDTIVTVSKNYIREVIRRIGLDLENRIDYIPNASPWKLDDVIKEVAIYHRDNIIQNILSNEKMVLENKHVLRDYLLRKAVGNLQKDEHIIQLSSIRELIYKIDIPPFIGRGKVEAFKDYGPLVLMTGRLTKQKGFHLLYRAIDQLVQLLPEIKILVLTLPVWGSEQLINDMVELAILYRENVRVILGIAKSIYKLAYLASNALLAPSLYEPFGLMALEAMAVGTPVVGSRTGGLAETILDILEHGVLGTGLLFEPGNIEEMVNKIVDLVLLIELARYREWSKEWLNILYRINNERIIELILSNPKAPKLIMDSCIRRPLDYNWRNSALKALKIYA